MVLTSEPGLLTSAGRALTGRRRRAVVVAAAIAPALAVWPVSAGTSGRPSALELSSSVVSGPVDMPAPCRAHRVEMEPQVVVDPRDDDILHVVYEQDGVMAAVSATSQDG